MKILVIQQKMIGDVLTSSILFEALRSHYPNAVLHYLIQRNTAPVIENNPNIDKIIFDLENDQGEKISLIQFIGTIRKENYDAVIDVYSKIGTAILAGASGAKYRIGYKKWYTSFLYNHLFSYAKKPRTKAGLAIENRLRLLTPLGMENPQIVKPKIYLKDREVVAAKSKLQSNGIDLDRKIFMISILGSNLENKTYPLPYMAELLKCAVEHSDAQLLLNYIPSQKKHVESLLGVCHPTVRENIHPNIYGESLREFMALTACCDALIGNEGGAINMAKALEIPTFAIFAPWIKKEAWNAFEDETTVGVHLKDYKPQLFADRSKKEIKTEIQFLYASFEPQLMKNELIEFLKKIN